MPDAKAAEDILHDLGAISMFSSDAMWPAVPVPPVAEESLPGFFLPYSISSATVLAGTLGCTASMLVTVTACVIGAKSRIGS